MSFSTKRMTITRSTRCFFLTSRKLLTRCPILPFTPFWNMWASPLVSATLSRVFFITLHSPLTSKGPAISLSRCTRVSNRDAPYPLFFLSWLWMCYITFSRISLTRTLSFTVMTRRPGIVIYLLRSQELKKLLNSSATAPAFL